MKTRHVTLSPQASLALSLAAADRFGLSQGHAREIIDHQLATIREHWDAVCDAADLSPVDRAFL